jgi:hypothetical protein
MDRPGPCARAGFRRATASEGFLEEVAAMKRIWMKAGVTLGTVFVTGAIVSACAHNDSSIFIRQVFAPGIPTNGECTFTADITSPSLSSGLIDVAFPSLPDYTPEVLIGNQIVSQANMTAEQTETSRVLINGAITRITDLAGDTSLETMFATMCDDRKGDLAACQTGLEMANGMLTAPVNPFSTVESTAIEPSTGGTASYGVLGLTMIDGATINVMRRYFINSLTMNAAQGLNSPAFTTSVQLISYTKAEGVTLGGDPVESNEFEFPVTITYGQLVANGFVTDPTSAVGVCLLAAKPVLTCVAGQDAASTTGSVVGAPNCAGSADAGTIEATPDAGGGG